MRSLHFVNMMSAVLSDQGAVRFSRSGNPAPLFVRLLVFPINLQRSVDILAILRQDPLRPWEKEWSL